jgi:hypothetical protein
MKSESEKTAAPAAPVIPWPEGVAAATGTSVMTLQRRRAAGDAPRLYAVSERNLVTTTADLLEWIRAKAVPAGYKCRAPVSRATGAGRTPKVVGQVSGGRK